MPLSECVPMDALVHLKVLYLVAIKCFFPFIKVNISLPLKLAFNFSWSRLILQSTSNLLLSLNKVQNDTFLNNSFKTYRVRFVQLTLFSRLFSAQKLFFGTQHWAQLRLRSPTTLYRETIHNDGLWRRRRYIIIWNRVTFFGPRRSGTFTENFSVANYFQLWFSSEAFITEKFWIPTFAVISKLFYHSNLTWNLFWGF